MAERAIHACAMAAAAAAVLAFAAPAAVMLALPFGPRQVISLLLAAAMAGAILQPLWRQNRLLAALIAWPLALLLVMVLNGLIAMVLAGDAPGDTAGRTMGPAPVRGFVAAAMYLALMLQELAQSRPWALAPAVVPLMWLARR